MKYAAILRFCRVPEALSVLLLGSMLAAVADAGVRHLPSDEANEVAYLMRQGTAGSLATASLLAYLVQSDDSQQGVGSSAAADPVQLIARAIELAPARPELVWLQLRECQARRCEDEQRIADRLKGLDPDNGFAWFGDLDAAFGRSAEAVTEVVSQIAAAPAPRIYWNALTAMMFDALTHHGRTEPATAITEHADDRLTHVTGVLAALDMPAFKPLAFACRPDQFEAAGRRPACEHAMARMAASDSVITQNVRLSVLEDWASAGSPERLELLRDRQQRRYLTVASNRLRPGQADRDAVARVDAMRHLAREEDVERAMLTAFHEPLERPAHWQEPSPSE